MYDSEALTDRLKCVFFSDERSAQERDRLLTLMELFAGLPPPPDPFDLCPNFAELQRRFRESSTADCAELVEEAFLNLYCHVHGHAAPYTPDERKRLERLGGYWGHAGGVSPILKAGDHIEADTVSGDFGAGNGLQGLLLQKLYPHTKVIQIEISSRMVGWGKELQDWLGIEPGKVTWVVGDVLDHSPRDMDFIYIYRPVRPEGEGRRFYEKFARELKHAPGKVIVFSIADCLKSFLSEEFRVFYGDGHLTCFSNQEWTG